MDIKTKKMKEINEYDSNNGDEMQIGIGISIYQTCMIPW